MLTNRKNKKPNRLTVLGAVPADPEQPLGLRERKKIAVKKHVFVTAVRLFSQQGYEAVSMDRVADEANVARRSVYRYFSDKSDLLFPFARDRVQAFGERMTSLVADGVGLYDAILNSAEEILFSFQDTWDAELMAEEIIQSDPKLLDQQSGLFWSVEPYVFMALRGSETVSRNALRMKFQSAAITGLLRAALALLHGTRRPGKAIVLKELRRALTAVIQ